MIKQFCGRSTTSMAPQTISSLSWLTVKQVALRATPGGGAAA